MDNFDAVDKTNFAFIAFNQLSGEGIAHGRRAIFALRGADLLEPSVLSATEN
jgi:hypothetical protein